MPTAEPPPPYALGDNPLAGDRLGLLAEVFASTTAAFVAAAAPQAPAVALDLGCGPGHTTALLARVASPVTLTGLDASTAFVERARTEHPGLAFARHDVTATPLPGPPADLAFCRYLLAHLPAPVELVGRWCAGLTAGGRLLVEEAEENVTTDPVFVRYHEVAGAMIAARGAELFVGRVLAGAGPPPGTELAHDEVVAVAPPTAVAARLFAMNLATWRHDPWVRANVAERELDELSAGLDERTRASGSGGMVFRNRQRAYERA